MKDKLFCCVLYVVTILAVSCSSNSPKLESALRLAGDNRPELEKVLEHYKDDPLKLKSAIFLIENMPGHYSYADSNSIEAYYERIDSIANLYYRKKEYDDLFRLTVQGHIPDRSTIFDVNVMSANFLIDNIDRAVFVWQNVPWAQHVDFDEFCEYILPYKVEELQTLDNWREFFSNKYDNTLDMLQYSSRLKNLATPACQRIISNIRDSVSVRIRTDIGGVPIRRMSTLAKIPYGPCDDYSTLVTAIMRAKGMPVCMDYTPQWPFRSMGHVWNVLLINYGKNLSFNGIDSDIKNYHRQDHTMAKVFRHSYVANEELSELFLSEKHIPPVFRNQFIKDVTNEYLKTEDIEITISDKHCKYVYLSVFDNQNWVPVHWARVKRGKAIFKDMGRNIVYLPVAYGKYGVEPISDPILIDAKGKMQYLTPDLKTLKKMKLYRKYPLFGESHLFIRNIRNIEVQASDDPLFRSRVALDTTKNYGIHTEEIIFDNPKTYRYWRFYKSSPGGGNINVAEIFFFEKDSIKPSYGTIIGTEGSYHNDNRTKEAAFDGDVLTIFDAPWGEENWVGMDFGKPVTINRIVYMPRSDGNLIELEDEYEFVYWHDGGWESLGKQIARKPFLEFDNCPADALFLLHNRTKGREERIFTYEDDEQVWW